MLNLRGSRVEAVYLERGKFGAAANLGLQRDLRLLLKLSQRLNYHLIMIKSQILQATTRIVMLRKRMRTRRLIKRDIQIRSINRKFKRRKDKNKINFRIPMPLLWNTKTFLKITCSWQLKLLGKLRNSSLHH